MHQYIRKINYYETDKMGITHHSNYVRIMEEARIDMLEKLGFGYDRWEKDGIVSPVIGIECEYKRPTTFADELRVEVEIVEYRTVRLAVEYSMYNNATGELVFKGKSRHCFVNTAGRPMALAKDYPEYDKMLSSQLAQN